MASNLEAMAEDSDVGGGSAEGSMREGGRDDGGESEHDTDFASWRSTREAEDDERVGMDVDESYDHGNHGVDEDDEQETEVPLTPGGGGDGPLDDSPLLYGNNEAELRYVGEGDREGMFRAEEEVPVETEYVPEDGGAARVRPMVERKLERAVDRNDLKEVMKTTPKDTAADLDDGEEVKLRPRTELDSEKAGEMVGNDGVSRAKERTKSKIVSVKSRETEECNGKNENSRSNKAERDHKGGESAHGGERMKLARRKAVGPDRFGDDRRERGRDGWGREPGRERLGRERDRRDNRGPPYGKERNWQGRQVYRGRDERDRGRVRERDILNDRMKDRERENRRDWARGDGREGRDRIRGFERDHDRTDRARPHRDHDTERDAKGRASREEKESSRKDTDNRRSKAETQEHDEVSKDFPADSGERQTQKSTAESEGFRGDNVHEMTDEPSDKQAGDTQDDDKTAGGKARTLPKEDNEPESRALQEAKGDAAPVNDKVAAGKEGIGSKHTRSDREKRDRKDIERDERTKKGERNADSGTRDDRRGKEESAARSSQRSRSSREDNSRRDRRSPAAKHHTRSRSRSRSPRKSFLADVDSRYRKFGGGRSGLGGYSPRRRWTSPDGQSHSPSHKSKSKSPEKRKSKSPEKKKARTWDQVPAGMSPSVAVAMQQYVVAQQAVSQATAAQQAAAKAQQALAAGQNPFGLSAFGLSSGVSGTSSLTPASVSSPLSSSLPGASSGALSSALNENLPASLQGISAALAAALPGGSSNTLAVSSNIPSLSSAISSTTLSALSGVPQSSVGTSTSTVSTSLPGLTSALVAGLPSISPMLASLLPQIAAAANTPVLSQATRPARRLYVGNMPPTVSDGELMEYINAALLSVNANHLPGTKPCINCSVNTDKGYAFAEFITPEDAVAALALDGISLHGTTLKIRRPKDYIGPGGVPGSATAAPTSDVQPAMDLVLSTVADSPYKVFIGGLSPSMPAEKVKEIITAFGQLRAFRLETDTSVRPAQAYAFAEYMELSVTGSVCAGLNGLPLASRHLTVCRATPHAPLQPKPDSAPFYGIPEEAKPLLETPTRIVELCHMLTVEELRKMSEDELREVEEDIRIECARLGNVKSLHIVRVEDLSEAEAALLESSDLASANDALVASVKVEAASEAPNGSDGHDTEAQALLDSSHVDSGEGLAPEQKEGEEDAGTTEPAVTIQTKDEVGGEGTREVAKEQADKDDNTGEETHHGKMAEGSQDEQPVEQMGQQDACSDEKMEQVTDAKECPTTGDVAGGGPAAEGTEGAGEAELAGTDNERGDAGEAAMEEGTPAMKEEAHGSDEQPVSDDKMEEGGSDGKEGHAGTHDMIVEDAGETMEERTEQEKENGSADKLAEVPDEKNGGSTKVKFEEDSASRENVEDAGTVAGLGARTADRNEESGPAVKMEEDAVEREDVRSVIEGGMDTAGTTREDPGTAVNKEEETANGEATGPVIKKEEGADISEEQEDSANEKQAAKGDTTLHSHGSESSDKKSIDHLPPVAVGSKPSGLKAVKRSDAEVEVWRVGRVYVEYSREDSASKAAHGLHGRLFNGRKVTCAYLPVHLYQKKFKKGLQPRTVEEKQALALAVQSHLTSHL